MNRLFSRLILPCCLLGPSQLITRSKAARLHRATLIYAWPTKPRYQWFLLLMVNVGFWYLVVFWIQLYFALRVYSKKTCSLSIAFPRQVIDLLILGLWIGAQPSAYYHYQFYNHKRKNWLNWVFPQQQATWHTTHSYSTNSGSLALLTNKYELEKVLQEHSINTTSTRLYLNKNETIDAQTLFNNEACFLKPNSLRAMKGCFFLDYKKQDNHQSGSYTLTGKTLNGILIETHNEADIEQYISDSISQTDYLIQTPLRNSKAIRTLFHTDELITFRIISAVINENIEIIFQFAEVPEKSSNAWVSLKINRLGEILAPDNENEPSIISIPLWAEAIEYAVSAHSLVKDIKTVAWDVCFTDQGAIIIEGNTGWAMAGAQINSNTALLDTPLMASYTS